MLEHALVVLDGRLVGVRHLRRRAGLEPEQDRLVRAADGPGLEVVVGQLRRMHLHRRELERLGDTAVQAQPAARDRAFVQRLAHERVAEREAVDLLGILDDQPGLHRRLERVDQLVLLTLGRDRLERRQSEVVAEHGRQRQRLQRVARQLIQALADDALDGDRHARALLAPRGEGLRSSSSMNNGLPPVSSHNRSDSSSAS